MEQVERLRRALRVLDDGLYALFQHDRLCSALTWFAVASALVGLVVGWAR